jgi:hypothetical protein
MKSWVVRFGALALALALAAAPAPACPACREAVLSNPGDADDDDPQREARAYHQSVYLMAGMPYLLLAGCGLLLYRNLRRTETSLPE